MPGPFDSTTKRLLREKPEHYVTWLVAQAVFVRPLPTELKSRNVFADGLFAITVNGKPALLHIEFQTRNDPNMGKRLLEYNILASSENGWLPVYTVVIYLRRDGNVPKSPFIRKLPNSKEYQRFYYDIIEIAKLPARTLLDTGLLGLLPLLPMTDGGTEPELMQEMTSTLEDAGERELLALAFAFGGLVDGGKAYNALVRSIFTMLDDILEESWTYQEILRKGFEKGREEERQQRIQEQRETVISFVQIRFPELVPLAEQHLLFIHKTEELHNLILKLFVVQTAEEARRAITGTDEE